MLNAIEGQSVALKKDERARQRGRARMRRTFHRSKKILDHNYAHPFILVVLRK